MVITVTGPRFSARTAGLDRLAIADDDHREPVGQDVLLRRPAGRSPLTAWILET